MSLEVYNNRTENKHENQQFRRVVDILKRTFDALNYKGVLIGNPDNKDFFSFKADAILLYDNGLVLIDFKDYSGIIRLPKNENDFSRSTWFHEDKNDRSSRAIKAGKNFRNPFHQLSVYRGVFKEMVSVIPNFNFNANYVSILNIFSGPIDIENNIAGKVKKYYDLVEESDLDKFIQDNGSEGENKYTKDRANALLKVFPAEKWVSAIPEKSIEVAPDDEVEEVSIDENVESHLNNFLKEEGGGIFVLESMDVDNRDSWMTYLLTHGTRFNIPQVESWSHSARISNKIYKRTSIQTQGVYSVIYGGTHELNKSEEDLEKEKGTDDLIEIIPIRSNELVDENGLIIIHEAHLINRSLNQSDLLRFGSGRLLEDVIQFLDPSSNRKIIFIGDPYSLTYGKTEDSALHIPTLKELYGKKIIHYRSPISKKPSKSKDQLSVELATSIENKLFNNLSYNFDSDSLIHTSREDVEKKLENWFSNPCNFEPNKAILFYSRIDCLKTNLWIKKSYLKNGKTLAEGDLLIMDNNIIIPDPTGLHYPKRIVNGMYFSVVEINEAQSFPISIQQSVGPVILNFTKLVVKCISLDGSPTSEVWILNNYFESGDNLSREEKIAFRVFINNRLNDLKKESRFTDSEFYNQLLNDSRYLDLSDDEKEAVKNLALNYHLDKESKNKVATTKNARKVLSYFNKKYTLSLYSKLRNNDPLVNAAFVNYGWAITLHKALGSTFDDVIIKGYRKENDGINNEPYFRWLYSGLATSENTVFFISPQYLNPMMNCTFKDEAEIRPVDNLKKPSSLLSFQDYAPSNEYSDILGGIENQHAIGAICEISNALSFVGFKLENAKKLSPYLHRANFVKAENSQSKLVLDFDNKGKAKDWQICKIRINKADGDEELINEKIEELFQNHSANFFTNNNELGLPSDFRNPIYKKWNEVLADSGNELLLLESHNNQDIFKVKKNGDELKFRVWYGTSEINHTKGFINKIEVLEKNSNNLSINLKEILVDDYQYSL